MGGTDNHWIQKSIKRKGRLRRVTGAKKGQPIPVSKLEAATHSKDKLTAAEAREAVTLRKLRKRTGRKSMSHG
jgi:hypothetical protein